MALRRVPSSSSTGTSWTNCSHQRRDDCFAVHSWMSNLQRRPARYMTATAIISGSHCRDSMVHRLPGTQAIWLQATLSFVSYEENDINHKRHLLILLFCDIYFYLLAHNIYIYACISNSIHQCTNLPASKSGDQVLNTSRILGRIVLQKKSSVI